MEIPRVSQLGDQPPAVNQSLVARPGRGLYTLTDTQSPIYMMFAPYIIDAGNICGKRERVKSEERHVFPTKL